MLSSPPANSYFPWYFFLRPSWNNHPIVPIYPPVYTNILKLKRKTKGYEPQCAPPAYKNTMWVLILYEESLPSVHKPCRDK
jgi:hypothetical protein